jgi:exonuclease III
VVDARDEKAERGVEIVVHKSIMRSVVKKMVFNDRIIALTIKAEPVIILSVQVYTPISEYEDEVEELYNIIEEILEEDGKGETHNIIMGDWKSEVGDKSYRNTLYHMELEEEIREVKCLSTFMKGLELSSPTHGLRNIREHCKPGKNQKIEVDTSWTTNL